MAEHVHLLEGGGHFPALLSAFPQERPEREEAAGSLQPRMEKQGQNPHHQSPGRSSPALHSWAGFPQGPVGRDEEGVGTSQRLHGCSRGHNGDIEASVGNSGQGQRRKAWRDRVSRKAPMRGSNVLVATRKELGFERRGLLTFKSALSAIRGTGQTSNSPPGLMPASHYLSCPQNIKWPLFSDPPPCPFSSSWLKRVLWAQ